VTLLALALVAVFPIEHYEDARWSAVQAGRPLVVGVRCSPPAGEWFTCRSADWPWGQGEFLVVSSPANGELWRRGDLPAAATADDVRRLLNPPPPSPAVRPCFGPGCRVNR
jgi:hypothetical protein